MVEINAEGMKFLYVFPHEQEIGFSESGRFWNRDRVDIARRVLRHENVRLVLILAELFDGPLPYFLTWIDGTCAQDVDQRVAARTRSESDFVGAIATMHSLTRCNRNPDCGKTFHTLALDPSPYEVIRGLLELKRSRISFLPCRYCGKRTTQAIVRVLDEELMN